MTNGRESEVSQFPEIPGYRVVRLLGRGGWGIVYEAIQERINRRVALKLLWPQPVASWVERVQREARVTARLRHPNIITAYDADWVGERFYFAMELVEGGTLADRIERGPLSLEEAVPILISIGEALDYAHRNGVIHRDVKPQNIMFRDDGTAVLTDFGIAREREGARLTVAGFLIGTPEYMSPQVLAQQPADMSSDLYSLGIILFEMLTGDVPFEADSTFELTDLHRRAPIPKHPEIEDAWPILSRLLAKEPSKRYPSAAALVDDLRALDQKPAGRELAPAFSWPQAIKRWWYSVRDSLARVVPSDATPETERNRTIVLPPPSESNRPASSAEPHPLQAAHAEEDADQTRFLRGSALTDESSPAVALFVDQCPDPERIRSQISVDHLPFSIGRADDADFCLNDGAISSQHVRISTEGSKYFVEDLRSRNGTFINGCKIKERTQIPLRVGDTLQLGKSLLTFVVDIPPIPDLTDLLLQQRYRFKRCLHKSLRAATYEVDDQQLSRSLAVKVFSSELKVFAHDIEDFRRQAESAAKLNHANIIKILDFGEGVVDIDGNPRQFPFLLMPLLDGGTLSDILSAQPVPPLDQVGSWVALLARALDYAHEHRVVHGGIKPRCILFDSTGNPSLTDFSIGRARHTVTEGGVFGSANFLAPEQWNADEPVPASDQYSLAAIAYLMITGARPYDGLEDPEIRERSFLRGPLPAHKEAQRNERQDVPEAVSDVLAKALDQNPAKRYETTVDFSDKLREALAAKPTVDQIRVFLSYHRESDHGWSHFFTTRLSEAHGMHVFQDRKRVDRAGRFPEKLRREIELCHVFVCLLGRNTLERSEWVNEEIRLAHEYGKCMIPVFQQDFDPSAHANMNAHISALLEFEAVPFFDRSEGYIEAAVTELAERIENTVRH